MPALRDGEVQGFIALVTDVPRRVNDEQALAQALPERDTLLKEVQVPCRRSSKAPRTASPSRGIVTSWRCATTTWSCAHSRRTCYGLEGVLNDATSRRIIDETIVPLLRAQDVAGAVAAGVDRMLRAIDGEALPPPAAPMPTSAWGDEVPGALPWLVGAAAVSGAVGRQAGGDGRW